MSFRYRRQAPSYGANIYSVPNPTTARSDYLAKNGTLLLTRSAEKTDAFVIAARVGTPTAPNARQIDWSIEKG